MGLENTVIEWITPKTDWKKTDAFNFKDYNRIKNNISYIYQIATTLYPHFLIEDMGNDILDYRADYDYELFNAWENNVETINNNIYSRNYGNKTIFYGNGMFVTPAELNRLESSIEQMKNILVGQQNNVRHLSFRLGYQKGIMI